MAYSRAREMILPKVKNIDALKTAAKGKKVKAGIHPIADYHDIFDASNALLAIDTGAADGVVREIISAELEKALALKTSEGKEIEKGSTAGVILDNTIEELSGLLATLKAPN